MINKVKQFFTRKRCKKLLKNNRGFSLMEVLVAVGIIAIISSIAVTTYQGNKKQAAEVVAITSASNILKAHEACTALNSFTSCDEISEMNIQCADCNESKDTNKFCVGVSKTVGGASFKVCIGKKDGKVQKTIGGTLLEDYKICHIAQGGTCTPAQGGTFSARPTTQFKKCENANNNFCGTNVTTGCTKTFTCVKSTKTGECGTTAGECS